MGTVHLRFPLAEVLIAAEEAAAATEHRKASDETEPGPALWWIKSDGTCLASNAAGSRAPDAYAQGWGPGTDARSILGGDGFAHPLPLCESGWDTDGGTLLDFLRESGRCRHTVVILAATRQQDGFRLGLSTE